MRPVTGEAEHFLSLACLDPINRQILERLPALGLPDCMLAGGSLFQTVWNLRCGNAPEAYAAKCARWKSAWPQLTILPWGPDAESTPLPIQENGR